jgi:hypothetical protein
MFLIICRWQTNYDQTNRIDQGSKVYVHNIPYIATFTILHNTIVESNYSMLLSRPWLRDAKATHDWGNNTITIQGKWYNLNHGYEALGH